MYFDRLLKLYKILAWKYREVLSQDPEDWCKIWRKTDLLFRESQNFGEIWPEQSNVSKLSNFICSYCAKYLILDIKKYRGVIFHDTERWFKIWRKTDLLFGKWHEDYGKFSPEHLKVSKLGLWCDPLTQSRKSWAWNLRRSYVSWQGKMMQNLKRNWLAVSNCFNGLLVTKVHIMFQLKK